MDFKKIFKTLLLMFIIAGILTVLLALVLNSFNKIHAMLELTGIIFLVIGFIFILGRSRIRTNDASWQSMQVRQHISQKDFYSADVKDSKQSLNIAWLFIIVGFTYLLLPMIFMK